MGGVGRRVRFVLDQRERRRRGHCVLAGIYSPTAPGNFCCAARGPLRQGGGSAPRCCPSCATTSPPPSPPPSPTMRLSSTVAAVAAAGLLPLAAAFTDTAPFLAFSSRQSSAMDQGLVSRSAASPAVVPQDISRSLTSKVDELCGLDALAIVEVESVRVVAASDVHPSGPLIPALPVFTLYPSCTLVHFRHCLPTRFSAPGRWGPLLKWPFHMSR